MAKRKTLEDLREEIRALDRTRAPLAARRDRMILQGLADGASLRDLAEESGLSHGAIAKIRDRAAVEVEAPKTSGRRDARADESDSTPDPSSVDAPRLKVRRALEVRSEESAGGEAPD